MISGLFTTPISRRAEPRQLSSSRSRSAPAGAPEPLTEFVAGPENALVRTLVGAATAPSLAYNPLVICGPAGVGKSTLAHLLAERRIAALGVKNAIITTGSDLFRALAHATDTKSVGDLRTRYHRCDLLLVDDLQTLADKGAAQHFLVTTFDALLRRGVLMIVTLRELPQLTADLSPGLASRLHGGLVVPLAPPQARARREIVRQLAASLELTLDDDLVTRLAEHQSSSHTTAAELRHAVLQVAMVAAQRGQRLQPELIAEVLEGERPDTRTVFKQAAAAVARHYGITLADLRGKSRRQSVVEARSVAMYVCRRLTSASYAAIGRYFGNRDHTTVLHSCRKVERLAKDDPATKRLIEELTGSVRGGH